MQYYCHVASCGSFILIIHLKLSIIGMVVQVLLAILF